MSFFDLSFSSHFIVIQVKNSIRVSLDIVKMYYFIISFIYFFFVYKKYIQKGKKAQKNCEFYTVHTQKYYICIFVDSISIYVDLFITSVIFVIVINMFSKIGRSVKLCLIK